MSDKVKVITLLPKDRLISLYKTKSVKEYKTIPNLTPAILQILKYAMYKNGLEEVIPVIGINRIYGKELSLEKDWNNIIDFLPSKEGLIFFELTVPLNKCLFIKHVDLMKFNILSRKNLSKESREKLLHDFLSRCSKEPILEDNVLVLLEKIDFKDCKYFSKLTDSWGREDNVQELLIEELSSLKTF